MAWGAWRPDTGGIPELEVDGETGLLVDEYDCRAAADRIVALASDAALSRVGEAAWLRAKAMLSAEVVRAQWLELLQLTGQRGNISL